MITLYDGRPAPKVIDFASAKATEQKLTEADLGTQYGTMVGTSRSTEPGAGEDEAPWAWNTRSDI